MKQGIVIFVEVTSYNIARINNVYEEMPGWSFDYIYCAESVSGHQTNLKLPENTMVLTGTTLEKQKKLNAALRKKNYQFIIVNGYADIIRIEAIRYAKKKSIPYAIETDTQLSIPHNPMKRMMKEILLTYIFRGNVYGFAGGTRQTELFRHYGMREDRIKIMPMTVNTQEFRNIALMETKEYYKEKYGFNGKRVVLYVGRFAQEKNIPLIIKASAMLAQKHDDFKVCLVGKGDEKRKLASLVDEYGMNEVIGFYPYKQMPELAEWYSCADVFVLASSFEPWGLVVNEALACRIPAIVSDKVGAGDDLIIDGKNGTVFPDNNVGALCAAIEYWLYGRDTVDMYDIIPKWDYNVYRNAFLSILQGVNNDE